MNRTIRVVLVLALYFTISAPFVDAQNSGSTVPMGGTASLGGPVNNARFYVRDRTAGSVSWLPSTAVNLAQNPSFEDTNLLPWYPAGASTGTVIHVNDPATAFDGDKYLRIENDTDDITAAIQQVDLNALGLIPGDTVIFSGAVRLGTGYYCTNWIDGEAEFRIEWIDSGGVPFTSSTVNAEGVFKEWTLMAEMFEIPEGAVEAELRLFLYEPATFDSVSAALPYWVEFDAIGFYKELDEEILTRTSPTHWVGDDLEVTVTGLEPIAGGVRIMATLANTSTERRALDLGFFVPTLVQRGQIPTWHEGFLSAVPAESGLFTNAEPIDPNASWPIHSYYPFSALESGGRIHSLGVPLHMPRVCHTGFDADRNRHFMEFHVGLLGSAEADYADFTFGVDVVRLRSSWGFRAVAKSYLDRYTDLITRPSIIDYEPGGYCNPLSGLFEDHIEEMGGLYFQTMSGAEVDDYAGRFHALVYSCPWGLRFPYGTPPCALDLDAIMAEFDTWLAGYNVPARWQDQAAHGRAHSTMSTWALSSLLTAGADTQHGMYRLSTNLNPDIPKPVSGDWTHNAASGYELYATEMYKTPTTPNTYVGVEADLYMNHNRNLDYTEDHICCDNPLGLVYGLGTLKPAAWGGLSDLLFVAEMDDHLSTTTGPLQAGNLQIRGFGHVALAMPYIDMAGFECSAMRYNDYCGAPEEQYFRRMVMNDRYMSRIYCPFNDYFDPYIPDGDEFRIFDELSALAAFYGFYPTLTKLYEEATCFEWKIDPIVDVPLLAAEVNKYVPLLEDLNLAGWKPITFAATSHDDVWIERYGPSPDGGDAMHLTVLNNPFHTITNEELLPDWPPSDIVVDRDVTITVESLYERGLRANITLWERLSDEYFYPGYDNGLSPFYAAGDWDGLVIEESDHTPFTIPARDLFAFTISSSMEVDNNKAVPLVSKDDSPYFDKTGMWWIDWEDPAGYDGEAIYTTISSPAPVATYSWTVIEAGAYDVDVIFPDIGQNMVAARYQIHLNGSPVGGPVDIDQKGAHGSWQNIGTVTTAAQWPDTDLVELTVTYTSPGATEALVVDAARLE